MCLIAFAIGLKPELPLWLVSNRDESLDRPTEPLHRWTSEGGAVVLGGRDLLDGGTWLGIGAGGRVAWLTNVRQADAGRGRRSRGELVTRWLESQEDAERFQTTLDPADYGGFNLVVGDLAVQRWHWIGNRDPHSPHAPQTPARHFQPLRPGLYGLSNASLDTPWPKTLRLRQALGNALAAEPNNPQAEPLVAIGRALVDRRPAPDSELPQTGVPLGFERALSSPFVQMPERRYGTRSSAMLRIDRSGSACTATLEEWQHPPFSTEPRLDPSRYRREQVDLFRGP